eukprot:gb/GECH01014993.1/.p1 GENE.gb/GECH01014993.1/~~gb/GECH01014993.1/.p1  ORF type:complete len:430 (+),score=110.55 gb/GECH01014993.1/:1-1290(+)
MRKLSSTSNFMFTKINYNSNYFKTKSSNNNFIQQRQQSTSSTTSTTKTNSNDKTGVLLMNMGGPHSSDEVEPFLRNLFTDRDIIQMPFQQYLGPLIAKRRSFKVTKRYEEMGFSPLLKWTSRQGTGMEKILNGFSVDAQPKDVVDESFKYRHYIAFRYVEPFAETALSSMVADGINRIVAFTQYPQWSCTTTGSSLNALWRAVDKLGMRDQFKFSVIDRWYNHPSYINMLSNKVLEGLEQFAPEQRNDVVVVFSAHSVPVKQMLKGDPYPAEISATADYVMNQTQLNEHNTFVVSYQSRVGPIPWLGPSTEDVVKTLGRRGVKKVLVVPISFTSDHIETSHEIDDELLEIARENGVEQFYRSPSFNDDPRFMQTLADVVQDHVKSGRVASEQYSMRCIRCTNPTQCRNIVNPIDPPGYTPPSQYVLKKK